MKRPKIIDIRATTVTVPLEAPLRPRQRRALGSVRADHRRGRDRHGTGSGSARWGGGGEGAEASFRALKAYLFGHDPFELEAMRFKITNPTASLYNNRTQLHAALEFACLDIVGKTLDVPVYDLLGGKVRDEVPFASYLFFRYPHQDTGEGEIRTARPTHRAGVGSQGALRLHDA